MQKTINYGLNKPDKEDFYSIDDFNTNTELIDTKLKELEESSDTLRNNKLDATATAVNADKLDGYHASDFVSLTNFFGGNMGAKTKYYPSATGKDCNDIDEFIVLASGGEGYHYPTAGGFWYIVTLKYSDTERKQIALDYVGNKVQVRYEKSGVWYDWVSLALSSEVPTGSTTSVIIQETAPTDTTALWVW